MSNEDWNELDESYRSALSGALETAHPAVEQAGGDERAAFELFVRKHCGMPEHIAVNWDAKFTNDAWEGWQARAALARVEQQERTIAGMNEAHAKLAGLYEAAQAQHSGPEGWMLVPVEPLLNMMSDKDHDTRITAERQLLSILADAPGNLVPQAWLDVQAERRRQITAEGWTPEHDDEHDSGELAAAGAAYALHAADHLNPYSQGDGGDEAPSCWPWHDGIAGRGEGPEKTEPAWWKPSTPRRDLVKACALALAEIERLDRAAPGKEVGHE